MKHRHDFEIISHPGLTPEATALGIKGAEIRRCITCQKELTFIQTKSGWFPLFEDTASDKQDILLA